MRVFGATMFQFNRVKLNVADELLDQILTPSVLSRQEYSDLCRYCADLCGRLGQWRRANGACPLD